MVEIVSIGWLTIYFVIVLLCVSSLLYLVGDYFKGRKTSKKEQLLSEKTASERNQILAKNLETAGRYKDAAEKYDELEMWDKAKDCRIKAKTAEAENLERAGRYESAALKYDELEMWDKAGECRRMLKTNYVVSANVNIGKAGTISMDCPHCGASQSIATKSREVTCKYCGKNYVIPKKVLDLL